MDPEREAIADAHLLRMKHDEPSEFDTPEGLSPGESLLWVLGFGPCTADKIADILGINRHLVTNRVNNAILAGKIRAVGTVGVGKQKRMVYEINDTESEAYHN